MIGGGPKAAAIASRARVLHEQKLADIRVTIFEPDRIGANWSGAAGYTNGEQRLCTIAERDVGYPYNSPPAVDASMLTKFSWQSYLLQGPAGAGQYNRWVDAGRQPPLHWHFADYLQWVVRHSAPQAQVVRRKVTALRALKRKWQVTASASRGKPAPYPVSFDGVVFTGPGPAKVVPSNSVLNTPARMFNGVDFWRRERAVRKCLQRAKADAALYGDAIVIIGAGGTAAAILAWLLANGAADVPIRMVSNQASLYTRVDSVFENRLFSDDRLWSRLSSESRRTFFDRLNRGVVWETVIEQISSARNLDMVYGRAQHSWRSASGTLQLNVQLGDGTFADLNTAMLIDCSGFDAWWFLKLLPGLPGVQLRNEAMRRERWQQKMAPSLRLQGSPWAGRPPLHAPTLSSEIGPGYGSLMVLGDMANRILGDYM